MLSGTRVGGPQRITRAPSLVRPQMFERATREWLMSPTRPTVRPSIRPLARRIVIRSSRPWRRVLVGAVAGVDDRGADVLGQQVRRAGGRVADDHDVGPHRLDVLGRVDERLALGEARDAGGEVLGVGREPLGRQAEAGPGPRRVLEEEVEDDPALERRDLLAAPGRDLGERLGGVEDAPRSRRATGPPARAGACGSRSSAGPCGAGRA